MCCAVLRCAVLQVDIINEKFAEAREEIDFAREDAETVSGRGGKKGGGVHAPGGGVWALTRGGDCRGGLRSC